MRKIQIPNSTFFQTLFICLSVFLLFQTQSIAQRHDHIVIGDTIFTEGKIKDLPSEGNTTIYFKKAKPETFKKYTIEEVNELMVNQRKFFRKKINIGNGVEEVFLELIPQEFEQLKLWSLNQETPEYFIEREGQLIHLTESYSEILSEQLSNPELAPLLDITNLNWFDLPYLLNTAKRYESPRTFTKLFGLTPYLGVNLVRNKFTLPASTYAATVSGSGLTLGFNAELFLNFKRNISLNLSPNWTKFDSQEFLNYSNGNFQYDSDVYMDYSFLQLPLLAKYYIDISPNNLRAYVETGYVFSLNDYKKLGIYEGEKDGTSVTTTQKDFTLKDRFSGYGFGIGIIKYFKKDKGIVVGFRNTQVKASDSEKLSSTSAFIGYKF